MRKITRRDFLLGTASVTLAGIHILSRADLLAYPYQEQPGSNLLKPVPCDLIIENAHIIDGTGEPQYRGAIGIKDDKIVAVGTFLIHRDAKRFDAEGMVVCPGFIDIHTHTENFIHTGAHTAMILLQGVTTHIGGNCGTSPFSTEEYFNSLGEIGVNVGLFAGYKSLRYLVMGGHKAQAALPRQVSQMQKRLEQELVNGAFGLSVGLEYYPQLYATTEELVELCQVIKDHEGVYATHLRNEAEKLLPALEEAIEIGQKTSVSIQYSHTKASFEENWSIYPDALSMVTEATKSGVDITADIYNYTFSSWDLGTNPLRHSLLEDNVRQAMLHQQVFFGSDSGLYNGGWASHPRAYGNYPRIIKDIVREKIMPLEKAIFKMTGMPAERLKLSNRGYIKPGMKADIVAFNPNHVEDLATYQSPNILSKGINDVWLNGKRVVQSGEYLGIKAGEPVLHKA